MSRTSGLSASFTILSAPRKILEEKWPILFSLALIALLVLGILAFSQIGTLYRDEGFHLVAAQLIDAGKMPYLDFFYQHPPLYAFLNAGWMRVFGQSWRSAHIFSALLFGGCILAVASFIFSRFRASRWVSVGTAAAAFFVGLHFTALQFGTFAQPYALCLFMIALGFRLTIAAAPRAKSSTSFFAGMCGGGALASSFLTAPVGPVLFLWLMRSSPRGSRLKKGAGFIGGGLVALSPLLWLAVLAPRKTFFCTVLFHFLYRWPLSLGEKVFQNVRILAGWMASPQGLLLVVLAALGLLFIARQKEWDSQKRAEFYLCAWLVLALDLFLGLPLPTLPEYFILLIPFLSILAAAGVYAIGSRIWGSERPLLLGLAVLALFGLGFVKGAYDARDSLRPCWQSVQNIAREVNRVTPDDAPVFAFEHVYFAARRIPPPGLENFYGVYAAGTPSAGSLPFLSDSQKDRWLAEGRFATVVIYANQERANSLGLPGLYEKQSKYQSCLGEYFIFWKKSKSSAEDDAGGCSPAGNFLR
jgi:4-amino-4-deoxy-L-arabinose transferase-like glycosyltransferase